MPIKAKCPHCKEPRGGLPLQRGAGFPKDCYEDAMREQERKKEAALISKAARVQYWDRWINRVRTKEARSTSIVVPEEAPRRRKPVICDLTGRALAGRQFEDARVPSRE